jgi:hypothetical protein
MILQFTDDLRFELVQQRPHDGDDLFFIHFDYSLDDWIFRLGAVFFEPAQALVVVEQGLGVQGRAAGEVIELPIEPGDSLNRSRQGLVDFDHLAPERGEIERGLGHRHLGIVEVFIDGIEPSVEFH